MANNWISGVIAITFYSAQPFVAFANFPAWAETVTSTSERSTSTVTQDGKVTTREVKKTPESQTVTQQSGSGSSSVTQTRKLPADKEPASTKPDKRSDASPTVTSGSSLPSMADAKPLRNGRMLEDTEPSIPPTGFTNEDALLFVALRNSPPVTAFGPGIASEIGVVNFLINCSYPGRTIHPCARPRTDANLEVSEDAGKMARSAENSSTYRSGDSRATITQDGNERRRDVYRYSDGHTIIQESGGNRASVTQRHSSDRRGDANRDNDDSLRDIEKRQPEGVFKDFLRDHRR